MKLIHKTKVFKAPDTNTSILKADSYSIAQCNVKQCSEDLLWCWCHYSHTSQYLMSPVCVFFYFISSHRLYLPGVVEVVAGLWGSEASQTAVAAAGPDTLALQQDTAGVLQYWGEMQGDTRVCCSHALAVALDLTFPCSLFFLSPIYFQKKIVIRNVM